VLKLQLQELKMSKVVLWVLCSRRLLFKLQLL